MIARTLLRSVRAGYIFLFGPVDPSRLALFARFFALTLLVYVADRARHASEWLTDVGYHTPAAIEFPNYPPGLPLLPSWLVPWFLTVFFAAAGAVVLGFRARWLFALVFACVFYVTFADTVSAFTLNNVYLFGFALLALAPRPVRIDFRGELREWQSAWTLRILQATMLIMLFTAGLAKAVHGDWILVGGLIQNGEWQFAGWFEGTADILRTQASGVYRTTLAAWMLRELPLGAWAAMQHSALLFELLAPVLFLVRRLRPIGFAWAIGFQLMIAITMYKVGYFNVQMIVWLIVFLPARLTRRVEEALPLGRRSSAPTHSSSPSFR